MQTIIKTDMVEDRLTQDIQDKLEELSKIIGKGYIRLYNGKSIQIDCINISVEQLREIADVMDSIAKLEAAENRFQELSTLKEV